MHLALPLHSEGIRSNTRHFWCIFTRYLQCLKYHDQWDHVILTWYIGYIDNKYTFYILIYNIYILHPDLQHRLCFKAIKALHISRLIPIYKSSRHDYITFRSDSDLNVWNYINSEALSKAVFMPWKSHFHNSCKMKFWH